MMSFLLFFFATLSLGKWQDPKVIISQDNGRIFDTCIDRDRNLQILYELASINDLYAITVSSEKVVRMENLLRGTARNALNRYKIECRANPSNDIMAFYLSKDASTLYFMESQPNAEYKNTYKKSSIATASFMFLNASGRVVFFIGNGHSLSLVTRPGGSQIFSLEQVITSNSAWNIEDVTSGYTNKRNEPLWHVVFRTGKEMYYSLGSKNGVHWEDPLKLEATNVAANAALRIALVASADISSVIFLFYYNSTNARYAIWSFNNGDSWTDPHFLIQSTPSAFTPGAFMCGKKDHPILVASDEQGTYLTASKWNETEIEFIRYSSPFTGNPIYSCVNHVEKELFGIGMIGGNYDTLAYSREVNGLSDSE